MINARVMSATRAGLSVDEAESVVRGLARVECIRPHAVRLRSCRSQEISSANLFLDDDGVYVPRLIEVEAPRHTIADHEGIVHHYEMRLANDR
jgi:hypothetical protein